MQQPVAAYLDGGERLHLQHGPIDLIISVDAETPSVRSAAHKAAMHRFQDILEVLVGELPYLRSPLSPDAPAPNGPVARRMTRAARVFAEAHFVTPMIAVAGSVADEIRAAICAAAPVDRVYVNNGGDISLHLGRGAEFSVAMASAEGQSLGRIRFGCESGIGGIATSGSKGRSLSLGIADSVTVLAPTAAAADAAATLIANAVNLPDHPGIRREPACELQPDSDLGTRLVVTHVPPLRMAECDRALAGGRKLADQMLNARLIIGAALHLQGQSALVGDAFTDNTQIPEKMDA